MMKQKTLLKSSIIILFFMASMFSQAKAQDISMVGVSVGDSFNFKVTQNDFSSNSYDINMTELATFYNVSSLTQSSQYDFSTLVDTLNASLLPGVGKVFGVKVLSLPDSNSISGKLQFDYGTSSKDVVTGFFIGTPVTIIDWRFWKDFLYGLNDQTGEPIVSPGVYNNTQTFNATLNIQYSTVPKELSTNFDSLALNIEAYYDAQTGVLNKEVFQVILISAKINTPITQTFSFERSTDAVSTNTSNSNGASGPVPGFEFVALLSGLSVVAIFYNRKRK